MSRPTENMFFASNIEFLNEHELIHLQAKRRMELIFVKFTPPHVVPDILYPQLRRFAERLQSILEETKYQNQKEQKK